MVRAKFRVTSIERRMGSHPIVNADGTSQWVPAEMWTIEMSPVFGNKDPNHENTKFWSASPSGVIKLGTVNKLAVEGFDLEGEFYVDFTPAPKE